MYDLELLPTVFYTERMCVPFSQCLRKLIQEHQKLVIPLYNADVLQMASMVRLPIQVRRSAVLDDAMRYLTVMEKQMDKLPELLSRPLYVKFVGESGQDQGGLRREFASLLVKDIARSGYLQGPGSARSFCHDIVGLQKKVFYRLGVLIALTCLQGGCGLPILAQPLAEYIVYGSPRTFSTADVPDVEIQSSLEAVSTGTLFIHQ